MIELRDYQKKAVRELKQKMIDMLNDSEDRQKLIFKAPTGAGKTVMVRKLCPLVLRGTSPWSSARAKSRSTATAPSAGASP